MLPKKFTLIALILLNFPTLVFSDGIEKAGDIGQHLIPAVAFVYSAAQNDGEGVCQLINLGAFTIGTVFALKYSINSKRPRGGNYSFPSGHTGSAFWGAAYLHRRYGLSYAIPAYLAASFVGFSRVHARKHHTIDVIAGAAIACIGSRYLVKPFITKDSLGVGFDHSF